MPKAAAAGGGGNGGKNGGSTVTLTIDGVSPDTNIAGDGVTSATTLTFSGAGDGTTPTYFYIDGVKIGEVTWASAPNGDGSYDWSFTFDQTDLVSAGLIAEGASADGSYDITVGTESVHPKNGKITTTTTEPFSLTIDTHVDESFFTSISEDTGASNSDGFTYDDTPTVSGVTEADATVVLRLVLNYEVVFEASTTADANGDWSIDVTEPLATDGLYLLDAQFTDLAGNSTYLLDGFFLDTAIAEPDVTDVTIGTGGAITVTGSAEGGSVIEVYAGTTLIGTTSADETGSWTLLGTVLADGDYVITATSTDLAGNSASDPSGFAITIDTSNDPPPPPPPDPGPDPVPTSATYTPDDPLYGDQWHLQMIGYIENVWADYTGADVSVGIYDNGVEWTHPDLFANYDTSKHVTVGGVVIDPGPWTGASAEHGTAVAGVIAAVDNAIGGVGVAFGASITGINIFSGPANINSTDVTGYSEAISQAWTFDIINNSWGSPPDYNNETDPATLASLAGFETAVLTGRGGLGTIVVKAAGNEYDSSQGDYLNTSRYTITVAAHDQDGDASWYTNRGANVLVSAPSSGSGADGDAGVLTTDRIGADGYSAGDYTPDFGGTSSATPVVSGVVALMLEANPDLGWRDVQQILAYSAHFLGGDPTATAPVASSTGGTVDFPVEFFEWFENGALNWNGGGLHFSEDYGFGGVDAYMAVRMAEVWSLFYPAQTSANEIIVDGALQSPGVSLAGTASDFTVEATFFYTPEMGLMELEYVELYLDFWAAAMSEISVELISPSGTVVSLIQAVDPMDASPYQWATTNSYLPGQLPGTVTWTYGVNAFRGEDLTGEWTVRLTEVAPDNSVNFLGFVIDYDGATLNQFQLSFYGAAPSDDDVYHYTAEMLTLGLAADPARISVDDASGTDWFDFAAVGGDIVADLNPGGVTTLMGVTIAQTTAGTVIENAVSGDGNDILIGNAADNRLYGMRGDDQLTGGLGNDELWGGAGDDLFVFYVGDGSDLIGDFLAGGIEDAIALYGSGYADFLDLSSAFSDVDGNAVIDLGGGDLITLADVSSASLTADDFLFYT